MAPAVPGVPTPGVPGGPQRPSGPGGPGAPGVHSLLSSTVGRGLECTPANPITVNNKHENNLILGNRACSTLDSELMARLGPVHGFIQLEQFLRVTI